MYLYLRYRFEWDERMYSVFQVCGSIGLTIGKRYSDEFSFELLTNEDADRYDRLTFQAPYSPR